MKVTTKKWDASEYLDSPEMIHEYLQAAFAEGDSELLLAAIGNVAKARGMSEIARKTNLSRQNLYKALGPNGAPKFDTVKKVIEALGCKLAVM
ncbi:addiction module antidote protein [Desulfosudis oleivorans]|uniref:Putative transcriptional regulator n=1 Tax=Desulfosudis oleivorans (strain DSM 6200 / JCM 39069 / Hxd3) TaxID=96561 RepID=A8ZZ23_DESOH|nr:addiction module antidote protein [Desulfosudis oleivorans]ABW68796.1 putative transcriptional regulator [Desulfosudis oleivorans Hxd3]